MVGGLLMLGVWFVMVAAVVADGGVVVGSMCVFGVELSTAVEPGGGSGMAGTPGVPSFAGGGFEGLPESGMLWVSFRVRSEIPDAHGEVSSSI